MHSLHRLIGLSLWCVSLSATAPSPEFSVATISDDLTTVAITFALSPHEAILQESIIFSTNSPDLTVSSWSVDRTPEPVFDPASGSSRLAYKGVGTITLQMTVSAPPVHGITLFLHYFSVHNRTPQERRFMLPHQNKAPDPQQISEAPYQQVAREKVQSHGTQTPQAKMPYFTLNSFIYEGIHRLTTQLKGWYHTCKAYITALFTTTSSLALQLLLAFLLGILMSLTPCIYPMIPITVGLLGTSPSNSLLRNFLLAAAYTTGLALVCALLGCIATIFGAHCSQLICNPWVLTPLIALLAYFGGSMLGWYELYIPRFLQPSSQTIQRGSLISATMLGIASGTIASPCMSPGLALLLSVVATLNNYFLGFMLLFIFGIGSSIPLLIIGTFSSSLHLLPRAGMWMHEIKKLFGFMLIMVCFHYAEALVHPFVAHGGAALFVFGYSIVYAIRLLHASTLRARCYAFCVMTVLLCISLFQVYTMLMWYTLQRQSQESVQSLWVTDYEAARQRAENEQKLLLLDFTASWCSYCILVDKQVLRHPDVQPLLTEVVPTKIDGSSLDAAYQSLTTRYKVPGIPLILLADPFTEQVLARWDSSLLEQSPATWVAEVRSSIAAWAKVRA